MGQALAAGTPAAGITHAHLSKLEFLTDFIHALSVDHYYNEEDSY